MLVDEPEEREPLAVGIGPGSELARAAEAVAQLVDESVVDGRDEVVLAMRDSEELLEWLDGWSR
ncbi:MAG TPA: hypothetical protein ENK57_23525 [Polyangiaceae bacterium]|nr:hypothetical protein [Polyangiaceae bacterium]